MQTILEKLSSDNRQVVDIELSHDKKLIELREACDRYYAVYLDKADFGLLIAELKELHEQMIDA
jgi:hypothetical protein